MWRRDHLHRKKNPVLPILLTPPPIPLHLAAMVINAHSSSWLNVTYVPYETISGSFFPPTFVAIFFFFIIKTFNAFNFARHERSCWPQKPHRGRRRRLTGSDCQPRSLTCCSRGCFVWTGLKACSLQALLHVEMFIWRYQSERVVCSFLSPWKVPETTSMVTWRQWPFYVFVLVVTSINTYQM